MGFLRMVLAVFLGTLAASNAPALFRSIWALLGALCVGALMLCGCCGLLGLFIPSQAKKGQSALVDQGNMGPSQPNNTPPTTKPDGRNPNLPATAGTSTRVPGSRSAIATTNRSYPSSLAKKLLGQWEQKKAYINSGTISLLDFSTDGLVEFSKFHRPPLPGTDGKISEMTGTYEFTTEDEIALRRSQGKEYSYTVRFQEDDTELVLLPRDGKAVFDPFGGYEGRYYRNKPASDGDGLLVLTTKTAILPGVRAWVEIDGKPARDWKVGTTEVRLTVPPGNHRVAAYSVYESVRRTVFDEEIEVPAGVATVWDAQTLANLGGTGRGKASGRTPRERPQKSVSPNVAPDAAKLAEELVKAPNRQQDKLLEKLCNGTGSQYSEALALAIPRLTGEIKKRAREGLAERLSRLKIDNVREYLESNDAELRLAAAVACAKKVAKETSGKLIDLLEDTEAFVQRAAYAALKSLTGQDFGPTQDASPTERARAVAAWKAWWRKHAGR